MITGFVFGLPLFVEITTSSCCFTSVLLKLRNGSLHVNLMIELGSTYLVSSNSAEIVSCPPTYWRSISFLSKLIPLTSA